MTIDDLGGLLAQRGDGLLVRPQILALTAAGKWASPRSSPGDLKRAMDELIDCLIEDRPTAFGIGREAIVLDWRDPPAPEGLFPQPSPEWRNLALRYASSLWDYAIATAVARRAGEGWTSETHGVWRNWGRADSCIPDQGWKLHVSATARSGPAVLEACADILVGELCAFKHAATLGDLETLTAKQVTRSQGGKFITVYPEGPAQARDLARRLHEATKGLTGPRVLSDKPYCDGSLVHYRYGVCGRPRTLVAGGGYEDQLRDPAGAIVTDRRNAWYSKPDWVEPLFAEDDAPAAERRGPSLLGDRYSVLGAIRHSYRGSVFRGLDTCTGEAVILKQARPNTGTGLFQPDAPDALLIEAQNLPRLTGVAPPLRGTFEHQGHLFMVQAAVPGVTLMAHVRETLDPTGGPPATLIRPLVTGLCRLLGEVHRRGLVFRDFTPGNIMVEQGGQLWLIDAEFLATPDAPVSRFYTPGFAAPELVDAPAITAGLGFAPDLYALGAVLYFVTTGGAPPVCFQGEAAEILRQRWRIAACGVAERGGNQLAHLILRLADPCPEARPTVAQVLDIVADDGFWRRDADAALLDAADRTWAAETVERLAEDGRKLVAASARSSDVRYVSPAGRDADPCNAQSGAAGLLEYLCRLEDRSRSDDLEAVIRSLTERICSAMAQRADLFPGLYFGAAGAAWATLSSAHRLGDKALGRRAMELVDRLPTRSPNLDLYHGAAGAGLALCRAWSLERSDRVLERIGEVADHLVAHARTSEDGVYWRATDDPNAGPELPAEYGLAHGVAGIGAFLLAAGAVTGRSDCVDLALAAGDTLLRVAQPTACGAKWPASVHPVHGGGQGLSYYQCNGSAGVGSFLVRLWRVSGHERHKAGAQAAAQAVHGVRWQSGITTCCGLAGCGQFLLDMAEFVDDAYAHMARDVADALLMHVNTRDGAMFVTDDLAGRLAVDYNAGLAGVLDFLGRLKTRGPRPWMVDELLPERRPTRTPRAGNRS